MTTMGSFKVQDVTFRGARQQSEIEKEIMEEQGGVLETEELKPPVSMTPEQIKDYLHLIIARCADTNEKRVYGCCIQYIDRALEAEKKLVDLELKHQTKEEENV